ncbi:MAG: hypothetical protein WD805_06750, partial [Gaiellaceae bacterium]
MHPLREDREVGAQLARIERWRDDHFRHRLPIIRSGEVGRPSPRLVMAFFADDHPVPARSGRPPLVSDAELVALAVAQAAIGISSDRQFLGLIGRVLPGWFPHLP